MNRPDSKYYRRNRRVKWSNPIFVWLLVLVTALITVPIQAAEEPPIEPIEPIYQKQEPTEDTTPTIPEEEQEDLT